MIENLRQTPFGLEIISESRDLHCSNQNRKYNTLCKLRSVKTYLLLIHFEKQIRVIQNVIFFAYISDT